MPVDLACCRCCIFICIRNGSIGVRDIYGLGANVGTLGVVSGSPGSVSRSRDGSPVTFVTRELARRLSTARLDSSWSSSLLMLLSGTFGICPRPPNVKFVSALVLASASVDPQNLTNQLRELCSCYRSVPIRPAPTTIAT